MSPRFSIVYPTRHRPAFVSEALRILELQGFDDFEVVVSDNFVDPALSVAETCRASNVARLTHVRPPEPLGMVGNWRHALEHAQGEYLCFLTDKMFVLPGALARMSAAIDRAGSPDIVSWTSDAYNPSHFPDYFGAGEYVPIEDNRGRRAFSRFDPRRDLDRRGRAEVSRPEQSAADYTRGKLVFGAYRRDLVRRIVERYGSLFYNVNPDYTSMVLGLSEATSAIEMAESCVVSVNTDISNGLQADTDDRAAYNFLDSLEGGAASILPALPVPGVYASLHNIVAHDYLSLKERFTLPFVFDATNWLVYTIEDVHRPGRRWSSPEVEDDQKRRLAAHLDALDPATASRVQERLAARARRGLPPTSPWRSLRRVATRPLRPQRRLPSRTPSLLTAVREHRS